MRFTKLVSAAAAVGVAGALALGGAATAHAATTPTAASGKITGIGMGQDASGAFTSHIFAMFSDAISPNSSVEVSTYAEARERAATVTLPRKGVWAPIIEEFGRCLQDNNPTGPGFADTGRHVWASCVADQDNQQYMLDAQGRLINKSEPGSWLMGYGITRQDEGTLFSGTTYAPVTFTGDLAADNDAPVAVTSPTAGQSVTTKRPVVSGTGEPGASVRVTTQSGKNLGTVIVAADGTWSLTPTSDIATTNPTLTVTQTAGDGSTTTATVSFTINAGQDQGLTATVDSVDADAMTAMLSGTGTTGDTITLTGPAGAQTVVVGTNGTWTATVTGLAAGDNTITATDGTDTITVTATIMPSPIVNPMIAGGAGLAALLALGTTMIIRRKTAA